MNKTCARCEKTVYPTEELKCLDKVWHKGCFKCQECGMTLNMRTYKGYGKLPYCEAHVPKAKHTTMAETPELKRIAENTKIQSNVKYHADFEKSKGKFTQVADDPETLRIKANTRIISNVAYHGDLEKKAQMEKQRQINENGEFVDVPTDYNQQIDNYVSEMLPPPHLPPRNNYQPHTTQYQSQNYSQSSQNYSQTSQNTHTNPAHQNVNIHPSGNIHPPNVNAHPNVSTSVTHHTQPHNAGSYSNMGQNSRQYQEQYYKPKVEQNDYSYQYQDYQYGQKIGRIQDYDPVSDGPRAVPNTQRASATLIYNSTSDKRGGGQSQQQQSSRPIGRVTDLDPLANEVPRASHQHNHLNQKVYIAMYDYTANDSDEVSFIEGDLISNVTSIDEGWMTGQVLRTGQSGMLPANYVAECPPQAHQY